MRVGAAEGQHALFDQRALDVVVFQHHVLAQGFDGKITDSTIGNKVQKIRVLTKDISPNIVSRYRPEYPIHTTNY